MHFSKIFLLAASVCLAGLVLAIPVPQSLGDDDTALVERSIDSEFDIGLELRALTNAQRGQAAAKLVQKQHAKKAAKVARKPANRVQHTADKNAANARKAAAKQAKTKVQKYTPAQVAARKDARNPKKAQRRQQHAAGTPPAQKQATKAAKAARRAARAPGVKGPSVSPKKARMSAADKQSVRDHVRDSAQKMRAMNNLPARNANVQWTQPGKAPVVRNGRDLRQAAMNSHLHAAAPVGGGHGSSSVPTSFDNRPYKAPQGGPPHPLQGQKPLPGSPSATRTQGSGLSEYPVKVGGPGFHGKGDKGKVRVITDNTANTFHGAITHASNPIPAGSKKGDHYQMN